MLALVAKKKLMASARSLGWPAVLAPLSNSSRRVVSSLNTCGFPESITFAISRVLIVVPAGLVKAPPRPSAACCATAAAHETSRSRINNPQRLTRALFSFIFDPPITLTVPSRSFTAGDAVRQTATKSARMSLIGYRLNSKSKRDRFAVGPALRPKALTILAGDDERLDHLGFCEVAIEL